MRLDKFLIKKAISPTDFATYIGVGPEALRRYLSGERLPAWDVLVHIDRLTEGAVTPNDFLPLARARVDGVRERLPTAAE
jgi:DNA-binding transcriptional regulator YdaS (Cro superfamily)